MSRLFLEPKQVQVEMNTAGEIVGILWGRRQERVLETNNRWRVADDWWRDPIEREYHFLITPTAALEVFQDMRTGAWFLERIVD